MKINEKYFTIKEIETKYGKTVPEMTSADIWRLTFAKYEYDLSPEFWEYFFKNINADQVNHLIQHKDWGYTIATRYFMTEKIINIISNRFPEAFTRKSFGINGWWNIFDWHHNLSISFIMRNIHHIKDMGKHHRFNEVLSNIRKNYKIENLSNKNIIRLNDIFINDSAAFNKLTKSGLDYNKTFIGWHQDLPSRTINRDDRIVSSQYRVRLMSSEFFR